MNIFSNTSFGLLLLRLSLGGMLLLHGVNKLGNPGGTIEFLGGKLASMGMPEFLAYGAFAGEVLAPLLIIIGFHTRIGALLIIVHMVFAIIMVHSHQLFLLTQQGGWQLELQGFFLMTAVVLLFTGSGRFAVRGD